MIEQRGLSELGLMPGKLCGDDTYRNPTLRCSAFVSSLVCALCLHIANPTSIVLQNEQCCPSTTYTRPPASSAQQTITKPHDPRESLYPTLQQCHPSLLRRSNTPPPHAGPPSTAPPATQSTTSTPPTHTSRATPTGSVSRLSRSSTALRGAILQGTSPRMPRVRIPARA